MYIGRGEGQLVKAVVVDDHYLPARRLAWQLEVEIFGRLKTKPRARDVFDRGTGELGHDLIGCLLGRAAGGVLYFNGEARIGGVER
jgi:hypothetical protein